MKVATFISGIITWFLLTTLTTSNAAFAENDNSSPLDLDSVAKLAEHLTKMSDQLNQLSENQATQTSQLTKLADEQATQSEQLSKLSNQVIYTSEEQAKQTDQLFNQLNEMSNRLNTFDEESAGPTFIRWGRRSCDGTNSEMVYLGIAAGTQDETTGGGANLLCLPRNPTFGNYDGVDHPGAEVDVAEYKLDPANNFPFEHNDPLLLDNNVPCAMCEVTNGSSVMMIPGRVDCYSEWRMEYRGYLMTQLNTAFRIEFVCVDVNPDVTDGGGGAADLSVGLYPVAASCNPGSLPCPPYGEDHELACVVCSK